MAFKVKLFHGQPDFESLHVAKIIDYPLEKRDYKPYSQCKLCFAPDGFHIQFLSFEAAALAASCMKAVFNFDAQTQEKCFSFSVFSDGRFAAGEGEFEAPFTPGHIHFFTGEDLQGEYWGANVCIPILEISRCYPNFHPIAGSSFKGNIYKLCQDPSRPHYGSYTPADFSHPLEEKSQLSEFIIIDY